MLKRIDWRTVVLGLAAVLWGYAWAVWWAPVLWGPGR